MDYLEGTSFGELLRRLRKLAHLTQAALAERIGAHRTTVSLWERGEYVPETLTTVLELARVLRLSEADRRLLVEARFGTASILPWHNLPEQNPYFTGREALLEQLHTVLSAGEQVALVQPVAIGGLGGIGKTQLALAYAYRYRARYHDLLWALAESHETLAASYLTFAEQLRLDLPAEHDRQRVVEVVKRWLREHQGWLLVLDNVEDLELVRAFVPTPHQGAVLLTTRRHETGPVARALPLDVLPEEEGTLFLLRRAGVLPLEAELAEATAVQGATARAIVEALGALPLALDQAGAYLAETRCGLADYLVLLRQEQAELLARRGAVPGEHPASVTMTFALAFERVEQRIAAASDLLKLCAYLAPEAIPLDLLTQGSVELGSELTQVVAHPLTINAALETLQVYSLVRREAEQDTLSLHRLVQAVQQAVLSASEQRFWAERAVRLLSAAFPEPDDATWARCQRLVPHALRCAEHIARFGFTFPEVASLLHQAGHYLTLRAAHVPARALLEQALTLREQALSPDLPAVARTLNTLADLFLDQGHYEQALPLIQRALALQEQAVGPNHRDVAETLHNLGSLYWVRGQYEQALPLWQRVLTICESASGPTHVDVAWSLSSVAAVYRALRQYEQALALYQRALAIHEQAADEKNSDVAWSLNGLANVYRDLGEYGQALLLYQRALAMKEQTFGPAHPAVARCLTDLAHLYGLQEQFEQAFPIAERALTICGQTLSPEHPDVAESLNTLARLYEAQGQEAEALPLLERALTILQHALPDHPTTAATQERLAALLRRMGGPEAASSIESSPGASAPGTLPGQPLV